MLRQLRSTVTAVALPNPDLGPGLRGQSDRTSRLLLLALATVPMALVCTSLAARADAPASSTVLPGNPDRNVQRLAVVSATDTGGDQKCAQRALVAAVEAVNRLQGNMAVPPQEVGDALTALKVKGLRGPLVGGPLVGTDYQLLGKKLKACRCLDIAVSPGAASDGSASYSAVAETYDTTTGGLVGHSTGSATVTSSDVPTSEGKVGNMGLRDRAIYRSVSAAVAGLNQTAQIQGVVVSIPDSYLTRISLGQTSGARQGARVEYVANGQTFGYGTIIELNLAESVATVAPETAFPNVSINTEVHVVNNPTSGQMGPKNSEVAEKDFQRFERDFAIGVAIAGAYYYGYMKN